MIEILGADQLGKVARELQTAASMLSPELSKEMVHDLQAIARTIPASALAILPRRGGLAADVARSPVQVTQHGTGAQLQISSKYNVRQIDGGSVTHPTYGHGPLVTQSVTPGFFSKPTKAAEPVLHRGAEQALQLVADKVK